MFSFLLLLLLGCVNAHDLNDTSVSVELDDTLKTDDDYGSFSELQNLINDNANGEINLTKSYTYDSEKEPSLKSGIRITNPITINGNGNVLDGNNAARIFSITTDNVVLNNITFINSYYSDGSAINWDKRDAEYGLINDCVFKDNVAYSNGVIFIQSNNILINNSVFKANQAKNGGAIYINIGANTNTGNSNIENCIFEENIATYQGGALYLNDEDLIIKNNTFIKNSASDIGGAIEIARARQSLINNKFYENHAGKDGGAVVWIIHYGTGGLSKDNLYINNTAGNGGGSIYVYAKDIVLNNETIKNGTADSFGGAIAVVGDDFKIYNSTITNTSASLSGGICIYAGYANNVLIDNVTFNNTKSSSYGGAIGNLGFYVSDVKIYNSHFYNTSSGIGGAIRLSGMNIEIKNSTFNNTNANYLSASYYGAGGAIFLAGDTFLIENCEISNSYALARGGGVVSSATKGTIKNTTFTDCSVGKYTKSNPNRNGGGAVYWYSEEGKLLDSTFINNYGYHAGGGIYVAADGFIINNTTFTSNSAYDGGGVYIEGINSIINNSKFINNLANYGGAGANIEGSNGIVLNSNFTGNNAMNYGGALSVMDAKISDCNITDNIASFGGGVYTYNSTIENTQFDNNKARGLGDDVFGINSASLINSNAGDVFNNYLTEFTSNFKYISGGWGYKNDKYYDLLFHEFNNNNPKFGIVDNSSKLLRNSLNGDDVSQYIKILFMDYFFNETKFGSDMNLVSLIYTFLETDYKNSNKEYVKKVIEDYNSGKRYSDSTPVRLSNNTISRLNFVTVLNPNIHTNLFGIYFDGFYSENITVKTCNKTANVGDIVEFEVNITNTGNVSLTDAFINLTNTNGLEYDSFTSPYNWEYNETSKKWFLLDELDENESATITLKFKATEAGNQGINVSCGEKNYVLNNSANNTNIKNPNFVIEQIVDDSNVSSGTVVKFTVKITNTGDCDLTNLKLYESDYSGLIFIDNDNKDKWLKDGDTFIFNDKLAVGESAEIEFYFNTSQTGLFKNQITVSSNETKNKTSDCYVNVYKVSENITVKTCNKTANVGDIVEFEVNITNTGNVLLSDAFINLTNTNGLEYDSFTSPYNWEYNETSKKWFLLDELDENESATITLKFKATEAGNQGINVSCGEKDYVLNNSANNTNIKNPNFVIEQSVDDSNVSSGTVVKFTVKITNTGDCDLTNLKLYESDYSGLILIDNGDKNNWLKDGNAYIFNNTLAAGETAEIEFYFNTSQTGLFKNQITVSSDETKNKTSDCYVNVYKIDNPKLVTSIKNNEKEIHKGEKASATITLKNAGDCDISNIFIDISDLKEFDSFTGDNWVRKGNKLIYNGILKPNDEINLIIKYKPEKTGQFISNLLIGSNLTETEKLDLKVNVIDSSNNTTNNKTNNTNDNDLKSNNTVLEPQSIKSSIGGKPAGNPIAILLLTIFSLFAVNIKIKK